MRKAFLASSQGLTSGSGKGIYRVYESVQGGDWSLLTDAEFSAHFDRNKYRIDLEYHPEFRGIACRRIAYDGKVVRTACIMEGMQFTAQSRIVPTENRGDGLYRPEFADFPWDLANLPRNVWNVDRLTKNVTAEKIKIEESAGGDLVGSFALINSSDAHIRFECPKKFGLNVAKFEVFDSANRLPSGYRIEWTATAAGLWYIRSLQHDFGNIQQKKRFRRFLKYTDFEPNGKVDAKLFTAESLLAPMVGS